MIFRLICCVYTCDQRLREVDPRLHLHVLVSCRQRQDSHILGLAQPTKDPPHSSFPHTLALLCRMSHRTCRSAYSSSSRRCRSGRCRSSWPRARRRAAASAQGTRHCSMATPSSFDTPTATWCAYHCLIGQWQPKNLFNLLVLMHQGWVDSDLESFCSCWWAD